jgi:hypothetical protein
MQGLGSVFNSVDPPQMARMINEFLPALLIAGRGRRARMIADELSATSTATVQMQSLPCQMGTNVIATLLCGRGAPVILSAHYDGHGAYDNASGVVVLLMLARLMSRVKLPFPLTCAFFDLEERGQIGSREFVRSLSGMKPRAHVSLDGVGIGQELVAVWNTRQMLVRCRHAEIEIACACDSLSFMDAGIPTGHAFSLPCSEADSFLSYRTAPRTWRILHSSADTPECLSISDLASNLERVFAFVWRCNSETRFSIEAHISSISKNAIIGQEPHGEYA